MEIVATAYVLIGVEKGKAMAVANTLQGKPGIVSADVVTGTYDVIAIIQGADANALARTVINDIQTVEGISRTTTNIVVGISPE